MKVTVASRALFDFGAVPVVEHAVGGHAAVHFGKMRPLRWRLARARHARLGVDDDVGVGEQQAGLDERRQRQQRRGRVAARVGDQLRTRDGAALALGEAVGEPAGSRCVSGYHLARDASSRSRNAPERSMTRTPASTSAGASSAAAESGSARNTTSASLASVSFESGTMAPFQRRVSAGQPPRRGAGLAGRHRRGQRDRRMARQQPQQLLAGEAGGAGDRDAAPAASASAVGGVCIRLHDCMHRKE